MDAVTKALIESVGALGYCVQMPPDDAGRWIIEATHLETAERFVVRADELYDAACELAEQIGIELKDG